MMINCKIFQSGDSVRVDPVGFEELKKNTKFIRNQNLDLSKISDLSLPRIVTGAHTYHGGEIVLQIQNLDGIWPQDIFIDYCLTDTNLPYYYRCLASSYYDISIVKKSGHKFYSVKNPEGVEVLRLFIKSENQIDCFMKIASCKSRLSFDIMFHIEL